MYKILEKNKILRRCKRRVYSLGDHSGNGKVKILRRQKKNVLGVLSEQYILMTGYQCRKFDICPAKGSKNIERTLNICVQSSLTFDPVT